jgi:hypothetical protein
MVLVVLATILAFLVLFSLWINRQVLNTDNWTRMSSEMLQRPAVRDAVAAKLTDQLFQSVDVEAALQDVLPPRAEPLAGPAANALRNQVEKTARRALARPDVQALWANANRAAHEQFLSVLNGGGSTVSTQNGRVVIDLKSLLGELQQRVGVGGRLQKVLPASATQITVMRSNQLGTAQDVARVLRPLPFILLLISLALVAVAMVIAPGWRRQVLRAYGVGFIVVGLLTLLALNVSGSAVTDSLANTAAARPVVHDIWDTATPLLVDAAHATILYGVVMIFSAWLAGPSSWARAVRRTIAPYLREPLIAYSALAVVVLLLLWWAPTPAFRNGVLLLILVALLIVGVEALRRQVIREFPDANRLDATARGKERLASMATAGRQRVAAMGSSVGTRAATIRAAPAAPEDERIAQLERLGQLRQAGVLEPEEFAAEKARILNGAGEPQATSG